MAQEFLRQFQGARHFSRDQRLRLEINGWRVLDFEGNPLSKEELQRQRECILRAPLVIRDKEYPFAEDVIVDNSGTPDTMLPQLAIVSSLLEVLRLRGLYEIVQQLWSQFTLAAGQMNIDVTWYRDNQPASESLVPFLRIHVRRLHGVML